MTAKEARELLESRSNPVNVETYNIIMKKIMDRIISLESKLYHYQSLPNSVIAQLKNDGYKVEFVNDRNETFHIISW